MARCDGIRHSEITREPPPMQRRLALEPGQNVFFASSLMRLGQR
jgi:hypothetical protein